MSEILTEEEKKRFAHNVVEFATELLADAFDDGEYPAFKEDVEVIRKVFRILGIKDIINGVGVA